MNFYSDSSEWKFLFKHGINWNRIIPLYYPQFPTPEGMKNQEELLNFFEELITTTGDWSANSLSQKARALDDEGAGTLVNESTVPGSVLKQIYKEASELELFGVSMPTELGGLGIPVTLSLIGFTQLSRASVSVSTQIGFFTSIADMIERFTSKEDREKFIPQIIRGEISGSMCLTEPGAGSDLGSIRTTASKQSDGTFLLNGSKCFITNGGGGLAFILARIKGAPEGLAGISMFFAEEWIEVNGEKKHNYRITKNEKKLGLHGSFTCEVVYENTRAKLVGQENEGLKLMFHLMNEARLAVALQSLGGIEACLHMVRQYAGTRMQFGKPLLELPLYKRNLQDWETERDAFRALTVDTISNFDIYQKMHLKKRHTGELNQEEEKLFQKASKILRRRTPLVKFYGAETYTRLSTKAIQALGGYGFMHEYDAERYHRDSFAPLLYEGTSQIQALMALKDLIKFVVSRPSSFFLSTIGSSPLMNLGQDKSPSRSFFLKVQFQFKKKLIALLFKCLRPTQLEDLLSMSSWQGQEGIDTLMTHAETITEALSYIETLRVLDKHTGIDESRMDLFERYYKLVTPRLEGIFADWGQ